MTPPPERYWVLLLAFLAAAITYLDRVCISVAAPSISQDLGLSPIQMGAVFSAFGLAYTLFEVPAAWLGDLWGQRKTMTRIVGAWSLFTMLTGAAASYPAMIATRFGFGAAEAGAFPTLSRALSRWFPPQERSRANGVMWMGARLGGALSPPLAVAVMALVGWRLTFFFFGCVGLIWCAVFWNTYRDDPAGAIDPPPAEQVPWRKILTSGDMLGLFWAYFASGFGFQFFVTWMPTFLMKEKHLNLTQSGIYAALPLAGGAAGCLLGGVLSDWLVRRTGSLKWGRRLVGFGGFLLGAVGFLAAVWAESAASALFWLTFSSLTHDLTLPVAWSTCVDVGGRFGGTASGYMNMASSISGMMAPLAAAWFSQTFGSFYPLFAVTSGAYLIGALLWLYINPERNTNGSH